MAEIRPAPVTIVRRILGVRAAPASVDLALETVSAIHLGPSLGLLTGEDPALQGVVAALPNLPPLPALPLERGEATLRVRFPGPDTVRLTLVPGRQWRPEDDCAEAGMLVAQPAACEPLSVEEDEAGVTVAGARLACVVRRHPFALSCGPAPPAGSPPSRPVVATADRRQVAGLALAPGLGIRPDGRLSVALELAPGELVTGLGEHFGPVVKNGQRLALQVDDALGSSGAAAYKAAPVWQSTAGYCGFLHTPGPAVADVGATWPGVLEVVTEQDVLDLFLVVHPDPKVRLTRYTALTGRPPAPPRWALGLWMSRCRYRDRGEAQEAADGLRRHGVPADVLHLDPDWLELDRLNCDFVWSRRKFGDPATLVRELAGRGFHLSLWECPYLDPSSPAYHEAAARGFLVSGPGGEPAAFASFTADGRPRAIVDMSHPGARRWWQDRHRELLEMGVATFTTDYGEGLPDEAVMADGRSGRSWHNLYPLWYNRAVAEVVGSPGAAGMVWGRSGWAGSQRYPGLWAGDSESTVAGMAATLRAGLSWAVSAPGWWGHDVGGFSGPAGSPSPELYVRWAQWGCLSPLCRFHGIGPREPWAYGERALGIVRDFARLRYRLLPYLQHLAVEAATLGWPVLRPLVLEHPGDRGCWEVGSEYLLGRDLLVVPVLDGGPGPAEVACYLPPGGWVDWWTGEAQRGPCWLTLDLPLERLPLFARGGSILPLGPDMAHTGERPASEPWTLHAFPGGDEVTSVCDGGETWRFRQQRGAGGEVVAVEALDGERGTRRAGGAVVHLPGGRLAAVPVVAAGGGGGHHGPPSSG